MVFAFARMAPSIPLRRGGAGILTETAPKQQRLTDRDASMDEHAFSRRN
jgi:hypothetical protein